jgi:hypothetical protein
MATTTIDEDVMPLVEALQALLDTERSAVKQLQVLELLMVAFARRAGGGEVGRFVIDSMRKHALQLMQQWEAGT